MDFPDGHVVELVDAAGVLHERFRKNGVRQDVGAEGHGALNLVVGKDDLAPAVPEAVLEGW